MPKKKDKNAPDALPAPVYGAPSSDDVELECRAIELRLAGMDGIEILQALTDEGATPEQAMKAYAAMLAAAEKTAVEIKIETECLFGIMIARKMYRDALATGDTKTQLDAEKVRMQWTDRLAKYRPNHDGK